MKNVIFLLLLTVLVTSCVDNIDPYCGCPTVEFAWEEGGVPHEGHKYLKVENMQRPDTVWIQTIDKYGVTDTTYYSWSWSPLEKCHHMGTLWGIEHFGRPLREMPKWWSNCTRN